MRFILPCARRARWVAAAAASLAVFAPAAAHADALTSGSLPLINKTEALGPGIILQHVKALNQSGWYDEQLLTVNLAKPAVSTNLLTSGPVASGGPLSTAVNSAGAVAGVNGDFFDIGNSNAAQGGEVQGGQLLKTADSNQNTGNSFGVSTDGLAQLVNLAVTATATLNGQSHAIASVNAADGSGVPTNGMVAYTSGWGTYSRARGFTGDTNVAEVLVENGKVVSVNPTGAGSGAIPSDGFVLVGRGGAANMIKALAVGDPVSLSYALNDDAAKQMKFAIGDGGTIVSGGQVVSGLDTSIAPRTAVGFKDDGHTLVLATWDGPGGTGNGGIGINVEAADLVADGVQTAVNLDGGGSTTMVARALGDQSATVRNSPSDGSERSDPNGIGVFVSPGDGKVHTMSVAPAPNDAAQDDPASVFPGMHRTLVAKAVDDHQTPVSLTNAPVHWSTSKGSIADGVLSAPSTVANGQIVVGASDDPVDVHADDQVRVLGPIQDVELSSDRLSIADATPDDATTISVTGRDDQGYTAPIEPEDLTLDYDHSVISVTPDNGQLKITPLKAAGTILTVTAGGKSVQLPITIGVQTETVYSFDDDVTTRWHNNSTAATTFTKDPEGLRIDFPAMRNVGISAASAADRVSISGQPLRIRIKIKSTISVPNGLTYINYVDGKGNSVGLYGTGLTASSDWQYATFTVPADTNFPIAIQSFQGINTSVAAQKAGTFILGDIEADVPSTVDLPAQPALQSDRLISDDGKLPTGPKDWTFGTISDIQFTADNPDLAQVATTAIHRIRQTHPDLIVLNGDVTDRGLPQDLSLARQVLQDAGCDLIPVGQKPPADSTPDPNGKTIPCYYVPGNHESYGLNNVQQDLTNFTAEFGQPYRYFDHKGTRFILLASSLGTLHGTAWAQLPMLQQALASAEKDPLVHNVMVFAHHPVDDPSSTKASQLGDRDEVSLIEQMLTQFRDTTGKGAAMIGSHAQVAYVHRIEGVPYVVLPSSGKDPYGTPDRGGFTGWDDWSVDPTKTASQQWLTGDIHAFAQSITLNTPDSLPVSTSAQLSGSIVQPEGVSTGTRVVPLQYPMSVDWGGSSNVAIGSGQAAIDAARKAGKAAILDPATRMLTALHQGTVTVSVTNDSMRPYTDASSLAPIVAQKTIQIVAATASAPVASANTPVFTDQLVNTVGSAQPVTVRNTGTAPLQISGISVQAADPASAGQFRLSQGACQHKTVRAHGSCTVSVAYAPRSANVTSKATLVVKTNAAGGEQDVPLVARSTGRPHPLGPDGPPAGRGVPSGR